MCGEFRARFIKWCATLTAEIDAIVKIICIDSASGASVPLCKITACSCGLSGGIEILSFIFFPLKVVSISK